MTKTKVDGLVSDWLSDSIDAEDLEILMAFRDWLRMRHAQGMVCFVAQEAWADLLPGAGEEETVH